MFITVLGIGLIAGLLAGGLTRAPILAALLGAALAAGAVFFIAQTIAPGLVDNLGSSGRGGLRIARLLSLAALTGGVVALLASALRGRPRPKTSPRSASRQPERSTSTAKASNRGKSFGRQLFERIALGLAGGAAAAFAGGLEGVELWSVALVAGVALTVSITSV